MSSQILFQKTPPKCTSCPMNTEKNKKNVLAKMTSPIVQTTAQDPVLLITLEYYPDDTSLRLLKNKLTELGFTRYDIYIGLECKLIEPGVLPSPIYKSYKQCKCVSQIDLTRYKTVLAFGKSVYGFTESSDLAQHYDFTEFNFNPTYFYKPINEKDSIRVYPVADLSLMTSRKGWRDMFDVHFLNIQLNFIRDHILQFKGYAQTVPYELILIEDTDAFLDKHMNEPIMAFDLETSSLDMFRPDFHISCLTVTFDGIKGYYLPFDKINKRKLQRFLTNKYLITANGKYDLKCLERVGVTGIKLSEDMTILFAKFNTERTSNSIKALAWLLPGMGGYQKKLDAYVEKYQIKDYTKIPLSVVFSYSILDVIVTFQLYLLGLHLAKIQPKVYESYKRYIIRIINVYKKSEMKGMLLDKRSLTESTIQFNEMIRGLEIQIKEVLGNVNVNSPEQLGIALKNAGLPNLGENAKGIFKTGDEQLHVWAKNYPVCRLIQNHRELVKLRSAFLGADEEEYKAIKKDTIFANASESIRTLFDVAPDEEELAVEGLMKFIKSDGRIHPDNSAGRAASGRTTHSNPNTAQIPKQGQYAKIVRKVFRPPPGYWIGEFDYSGFQLRIGAIQSNDANMIDAFVNQGGDLHSVTGRMIFTPNISLEEFMAKKKENPYKRYRQDSKAVNFLFEFGGSYSLLAPVIKESWTPEEIRNYIQTHTLDLVERDNVEYEDLEVLTVCKDIQDRFFSAYPGLHKWVKENPVLAKTQGYIDSILGGRRHLTRLMYQGQDDDQKLIRNLNNISLNSMTQNFEAFTIYEAMANIDDEFEALGMKSHFVTMVHDAMVLYIKKEESQMVYEICKKHITIPTEVYGVPIIAEFGAGLVWGFDYEMNDDNIDVFTRGGVYLISYENSEGKMEKYDGMFYNEEDAKAYFEKKLSSKGVLKSIECLSN